MTDSSSEPLSTKSLDTEKRRVKGLKSLPEQWLTTYRHSLMQVYCSQSWLLRQAQKVAFNNPLSIFTLLYSFYPLPLKSKEGSHWELKGLSRDDVGYEEIREKRERESNANKTFMKKTFGNLLLSTLNKNIEKWDILPSWIALLLKAMDFQTNPNAMCVIVYNLSARQAGHRCSLQEQKALPFL